MRWCWLFVLCFFLRVSDFEGWRCQPFWVLFLFLFVTYCKAVLAVMFVEVAAATVVVW